MEENIEESHSWELECFPEEGEGGGGTQGVEIGEKGERGGVRSFPGRVGFHRMKAKPVRGNLPWGGGRR